MGHSTGGLIAALWAAQNADRLEGLILNSPWLDMQGSAIVRTLGTPVINALGSRAPTSVIRLPDLGFTARTLHICLGGEWDYDLDLKSTPSPPIRTGWLRAVLLGHQRVAAGLAIGVRSWCSRRRGPSLRAAGTRVCGSSTGARRGADRRPGGAARPARHRCQDPGRPARRHVVCAEVRNQAMDEIAPIR